MAIGCGGGHREGGKIQRSAWNGRGPSRARFSTTRSHYADARLAIGDFNGDGNNDVVAIAIAAAIPSDPDGAGREDADVSATVLRAATARRAVRGLNGDDSPPGGLHNGRTSVSVMGAKALSASATSISGTEGRADFPSAICRAFTHSALGLRSQRFMQHNWGDGNTKAGTIIDQEMVWIRCVNGTNTYVVHGSYTTTVTIADSSATRSP